MISRLGRWLVPAFFGPLLALWLAITISVFVLGQWDPKLGKWGSWALARIFGTLMGGFQGVVFVLIDALLLRFRRRLLPMGGRAWLMGLAAPFLVISVWHLMPPNLAVLVLPMVGVALLLRLLFSPRFA